MSLAIQQTYIDDAAYLSPIHTLEENVLGKDRGAYEQSLNRLKMYALEHMDGYITKDVIENAPELAYPRIWEQVHNDVMAKIEYADPEDLHEGRSLFNLVSQCQQYGQWVEMNQETVEGFVGQFEYINFGHKERVVSLCKKMAVVLELGSRINGFDMESLKVAIRFDNPNSPMSNKVGVRIYLSQRSGYISLQEFEMIEGIYNTYSVKKMLLNNYDSIKDDGKNEFVEMDVTEF